MKASDIMIRQVIKVKEYDTVLSVLTRFVDHRISGMPVVNDRNEAVGYISDGDIMRWIGKYDPIVFQAFFFTGVMVDRKSMDEKFHDLIKRTVLEVATRKVVSVSPNDELDSVAGVLGAKRIKKVPVIRDRVVVGIISRGDIIRAVTQHYLNGWNPE